MASTIVYFNDRDAAADFSFNVSALSNWPGQIGSASRDVPVLDGPEMQGGILDPRLIRRKPGQATIKGYIKTASPALALAATDALAGTLSATGEVSVRTGYVTDRHCLAVCTGIDSTARDPTSLDGNLEVTMSFLVKDGVAVRLQPDGYSLSTGRTACPIGTAESKPIIVVHGGGVALTNPVVTVRNAGGDIVQQIGFTLVLGANDALRIDSTRGAWVSKIASGVISDGMSYWSSGDWPILRPADAWAEAGSFATVELSASVGTPVGQITYTRRYA